MSDKLYRIRVRLENERLGAHPFIVTGLLLHKGEETISLAYVREIPRGGDELMRGAQTSMHL